MALKVRFIPETCSRPQPQTGRIWWDAHRGGDAEKRIVYLGFSFHIFVKSVELDADTRHFRVRNQGATQTKVRIRLENHSIFPWSDAFSQKWSV